MTATLLIVDDDPDARVLLRDFVRIEGFAALAAASGEEALRLLDSSAPDVILLDAVLAGLDGFETCRRIKAREACAHLPVIFMTGLTETEHVVQGFAAGGVDYVTKPLALDELAARIRVHVANARTTRSALSALDSFGTRLLACDVWGRIGWATPEMQRLLDVLELACVEELRALLRQLIAAGAQDGARFACGEVIYALTLLGPAADDYLFKLVRSTVGQETRLLREAFSLTPREAEVLLWIARGKSNKDASEILNISARTVNKHLEQIFTKIGVENRSSAAIAATRIILQS